MKRYLFLIIGFLVLFFIALFFYVRSASFRTLVEKKINQATKGNLIINGPLHLSFYPLLGISMNDVVLKNPTGFGAKPLFQFNEMSLSLRLIPLLVGKIIPATLVIHKGDINLVRNRNGKINWNTLFYSGGEENLSSWTFIPKKIDIKNVNLYFDDMKNNRKSNILDIHFKIQPSLAGDINIQDQSSNKKLINQLNIKGKLRIRSAQFDKFKVSNIRTNFNDEQGMLTFPLAKANLYNGTFSGHMSADFRKQLAQYSLKGAFKNITVQNLFTDLFGYKRLIGVGEMNVELTANSIDPINIISSLNGKLNFHIKNGDLLGINFPSILNIGVSLIKTITIIPRIIESTKEKTTFGSMRGSAVIRNGIITNNDLYILTQDIEGRGKGTINLVNQQINYLFEIRPQGKTIVVRASVTGALGNPEIQVYRRGFVPTLFQSFIPGPVKK